MVPASWMPRRYILQCLRQEKPVEAALPIARVGSGLALDVIELIAHRHFSQLPQQPASRFVFSREGIEQREECDFFPPAFSWRAISNATVPPKDNPPSRYGPSG